MFTFGAGGCGQLGHGSTDSTATPTKLSALVGSTVSQIACGRYVCTPSRKCIVASHLSEHVGTGGCSDNYIVKR